MHSMAGPGEIILDVNGERRRVHIRPADVLAEILRTDLGLTGAKPGCENGDCGACTVLVDGVPQKSCLVLAVEAAGHRLETVEGLHDEPLQKAFVELAALQRGYCTSGMLMVCAGLVRAHPDADGRRVVEYLRSNICRCTGFQEIQEAVEAVLGHPAPADAAHAYVGGQR